MSLWKWLFVTICSQKARNYLQHNWLSDTYILINGSWFWLYGLVILHVKIMKILAMNIILFQFFLFVIKKDTNKSLLNFSPKRIGKKNKGGTYKVMPYDKKPPPPPYILHTYGNIDLFVFPGKTEAIRWSLWPGWSIAYKYWISYDFDYLALRRASWNIQAWIIIVHVPMK